MDGYQTQRGENGQEAVNQTLELLYLTLKHIGEEMFDKFRFEANFMNVFFGFFLTKYYNRKALQRIVNTAGRIIGAPLPSLQDIYTTHLTRKATTIVSDASHPAHNLFSLLPSGRRYRSLGSRTTRLTNSFIHQAVRMLNSLWKKKKNVFLTFHHRKMRAVEITGTDHCHEIHVLYKCT